MIFLEVLTEGSSDVPAVKEILTRRFKLKENEHFRIHPHRGKGSLPDNPLSLPDPKRRGLLDQLPAKLRGYAHMPQWYCIVVLVDSDDTECRRLKQSLVGLYSILDRRPNCVLF